MPALTPGTVIRLVDGSPLTVVSYIAGGGQGEVYRVRKAQGGTELALKWYTNESLIGNDSFRRTLINNSRRPSPSSTFLWPLAITNHQHGSYGYVMRLRPEGYIDMGKFFCIDENPQAYFRSTLAKLTAGIQICDAFARLHNQGYSYQDVNDGSFLIDPHRGRVLICDNDNIVPNGINTGIAGKPHYMAPEVAMGRRPNTASDRFSLAIILYRLFMVDHPFEGRRTTTERQSCLTPEQELQLFGSRAVFCHDADDDANRPVEGLHDNSITFWPLLTPTLQRAFRVALSRTAIANPVMRIRASSWKQMLLAERASLVTCQASASDPVHDYMCEGPMPSLCPLCSENSGLCYELHFASDSERPYRLTEAKPLFLGDSTEPVAICRKVVSFGTTTLALENISTQQWSVATPSGQHFSVAPATRCQLVPGLTIYFGAIGATVRPGRRTSHP